MIKAYNPRRLGLLAVTMMTLAGCAAGPQQSIPANAAKPGCCAGMTAGEGCCKGMGMCPMSGGASNMTNAKDGGDKDAAKPSCCAGMAASGMNMADGGCCCCKGMDGATR